MTIRGYNEIDEQGVLDLLEELRGSAESSAFSLYLQDSSTYKNSYLKTKNYIVLVALDDKDKTVTGFIVAEHYLNDTVNLVMLYVGKEFRRKGIAFKLKTAMYLLCSARGYKKIVSQVRMNNEKSIQLNIKSGWKQEIDKVYPHYYYWFSKEL